MIAVCVCHRKKMLIFIYLGYKKKQLLLMDFRLFVKSNQPATRRNSR